MKPRLWLGIAMVVILGAIAWLQWQGTPLSTGFGGFQPQWRVVSIHDGDTIRVRRGNQVERIRFACIDAPELSQPLGIASRDHLRQLIKASDNRVSLKISGRDRYDRKVAEVFAKGKLLQTEQVRTGLAYVYRRYLKDCPDAPKVEKAEAIAQRRRLGVWKNPGAVKPWDYRRAH